MKIYDKLHSFSCDKEMKEFLLQMKRTKVNVSKFIRLAIYEKMERDNLILKIDKRKKTTVLDLKKSLAIFEKSLEQ